MLSTRSRWSSSRTNQRAGIAVSALAVACVGFLLWLAFVEATQPTLVHYIAILYRPDLTIFRISPRAEAVGLRNQDRLLNIGGEDVSTLMQARDAIVQQPLGSTIPVVVRRSSQAVTLDVPVRAKGIGVEFATRYALALAFLIPCVIATLLRPQDRTVQLFALTSLSLALYFGLLRQDAVGLIAAQLVVLCLASGFTLHFFLTFPQPRWEGAARRWFLVYLPSLFLMAMTLREFVRSVEIGRGKWFAPRLDAWIRADFAYLSFAAAVGLAVVAYTLATTSNPTLKQQLKWILLGLACAVAAGVADLALTLGEWQSDVTGNLLLLGTIALPVTFAFAILRYHLLDVDLVIRRSVVYGLLTAGLAAVYLLIVSLATEALGLSAGSLGHSLVLFASAVVAGALLSPARVRVQALIDRYFFGQAVDLQHAMVRWSQELSSHLRLSDLAHILVEEIPRELRIDRASLLLPNAEKTHLVPIRSSGHDGEPADPGSSPLAIGHAAAERIVPAGILVLDQRRPERADPAVEAALTAWQQAGMRVAVPLSSGGLVGIHLLGAKPAGALYQGQELVLLRTLGHQAAVAISNARLYEAVRASSEELEAKVQQRTREMRDLLSVVAHELSAPTTAIQGYTELLLDRSAGPITDRQTRFLENIRRNGHRLGRLLLDLSDSARLDGGRIAVSLEPIDLVRAAEEALDGLRTVVDEKGLQVRVDMAPDAARVLGDPQRVDQILTNLLSNACRYTPAGGQITVRSRAADGSVEIAVSDTGIGIQPQDLPRIFERFFRSAEPEVREQPGAGLGLSIARSLVELHGGRIWVDSEPGEGSTFRFTLPACP